MKFFAVFAAIVAVACATPSGWTLQKVSDALQNPLTGPLKPAMEKALDSMMDGVFHGHINVSSNTAFFIVSKD
jgi:glutamate racemase